MPTRFMNVSPLGALDIPALHRTVEAGEVFDAPDVLVSALAEQATNFVEVDGHGKPVERPSEGPSDLPGDEPGDEEAPDDDAA